RRQPVPRGDGFTHPDPLVRATNVVRVLAGREQLAEDLLDGANVVYLVPDDRGEGLVEKWHAVVSAIVVYEARAVVGHLGELEICVVVPVRDADRVVQQRVPTSALTLEHRRVQRHPARFGGFAGSGEQRLRPGQPAAHHCDIPSDLTVHARQRARHAHRPHRVAIRTVGRVGPLPRRYRRGEVKVEIPRSRLLLERGPAARSHTHSIHASRLRRTVTGADGVYTQSLAVVVPVTDRSGCLSFVARDRRYHSG